MMDLEGEIDSTSNIDNDVQSEVTSILSKWSKNINIHESEEVVKEINDDDMKETVKNLVKDLSPRKSDVSSYKPSYPGGRIWKSAIPPKNHVSTPSPPRRRKSRKSKKKIPSKLSPIQSRTLPPKRFSRGHLTVNKSKKKEKKPNFLLTSTSFHKRDSISSSSSSKPKKKRRKVRKKIPKKGGDFRRPPKLIHPTKVSTRKELPPKIQNLRNEFDRMSSQNNKYNNNHNNREFMTGKRNRFRKKNPNTTYFPPPPVVDSSLHETLKERVEFLKSQLKETIRPPPFNTLPISPHGSPVVSRYNPQQPRIVPLDPQQQLQQQQQQQQQQFPSIIGDGNIQYEAQQAKQEELEKELSRLRNELMKQKHEKMSATNELKALEIEKEKKRLQSAIKEREAREKKAFEEVNNYRNTRILIRYFSRWRRSYHLKIENGENDSGTNNARSTKKKSGDFRVKIGVIFEWKLKRRMFRKFRRVVQIRRDQREEKRIKERLRQDQVKMEMVKRERRVKTLTKYFQKWFFKTRMKAAERGFQKEREVFAKQRSKFLSRFRTKLTGEEEDDADADDEDEKVENDRNSGGKIRITNLSNEEAKVDDRGDDGIEEELEDIPFLEGKKIKRIRKLKSSPRDQSNTFIVHNNNDDNDDEEEEDNRGSNSSPNRTRKRRKKKKKKNSVSGSNKFKRPLFVKTMEDRQKLRKENWKKLKEKYRAQDEEKIRMEQQEQLRIEEEEKVKKREDKEKKKQVEARKRTRLKERRKKKEMYRKKVERADELRKKLLLKYYGWIHWRKFLAKRRELSNDARKFYRLSLKRRVFISWLGHSTKIREERVQEEQRKVDVYERVVELRRKKSAFQRWRERLKTTRENLKKYDLVYRKNVKRKYLNIWAYALIKKRKKREKFLEEMEESVVKMGRKVTLGYYFGKLLRMMDVVREEREKEDLGKSIRAKVDTWITEFRLKRNFSWDQV